MPATGAGVEWFRLPERKDGVKELLEALLVAVAGFFGGFVSTLASNGSAVTLPALGLVSTISFYRQGSSIGERACR